MTDVYRFTEGHEDALRAWLATGWPVGRAFDAPSGQALALLAAHTVLARYGWPVSQPLSPTEMQWLANEIGELELGMR